MNEAKRTAVLGLVFCCAWSLRMLKTGLFSIICQMFFQIRRVRLFLRALLRDLYLKMFMKPTSIRAAMRNIP